jgi:hypothetical protein
MSTDTMNVSARIAQAVTRWHSGHARRQELPTCRTNRPCMGIAALVHDFDQNAIAVGDRTFLPNHALTWMSVRDLPPGLMPLSPAIHRRGATFVHTAQATLRYGMPVIDFTANASGVKDLKRQPVPDCKASSVRPDMFALPADLRHFETAIAISECMTDYAEQHRIRHHVPPIAPMFPRPYFQLESLLANTGKVSFLLSCQGIVCGGNGSVFLAAWASGRLRIHVASSQMWWDVTHLADCLDGDLEAFLLPPIHIPHWSTANRQIAGETAIIVQGSIKPSTGCRVDRDGRLRQRQSIIRRQVAA